MSARAKVLPLAQPEDALRAYLRELVREVVREEARAGGTPALRTFAVYRMRAGLTVAELALEAGVSVQTVRALERGAVRRPDVGILTRLAVALGVEPGQFRADVAAECRGQGVRRGC